MKHSISALAAIFILCIFVAGVYAEESAPAAAAATATAPAPPPPDVTGSVTLTGLNKYIFRGAELSADSAVFEPSVTINYKGFSLNVWGNYDTDQHQTQGFIPGQYTSAKGQGLGNGQSSWNETDFNLSYTYNIDKVALTGGYIYYAFDYATQTQEVYLSGTYDMIAHPTLAVYRDIDAHPGFYFNLSFSQSLPIYKLSNGDVTVDLGTGFGFYDVTDQSLHYVALHDGNVKVGFTVPVYKNVVVQPVMQYWFPLSGKAHHDDNIIVGNTLINTNPAGHIDNTFVYGVGMTLNF